MQSPDHRVWHMGPIGTDAPRLKNDGLLHNKLSKVENTDKSKMRFRRVSYGTSWLGVAGRKRAQDTDTSQVGKHRHRPASRGRHISRKRSQFKI